MNLVHTLAAMGHDEVAGSEEESGGEMWSMTVMELRRSSNNESKRTR